MRKIIFVYVILLTLLASCSTTNVKFTPTDVGGTFDCEFKVLSFLPKDIKYEEIGIYNMRPNLVGNPKTPLELKKFIHKDVCKLGGTFVVADVNDDGRYMRVTVFKEVKE